METAQIKAVIEMLDVGRCGCMKCNSSSSVDVKPKPPPEPLSWSAVPDNANPLMPFLKEMENLAVFQQTEVI